MVHQLIIAVGLAWLAQAPEVTDKVADDAQALQGLWVEVGIESDGKKRAKDDLKAPPLEMFVKGAEIWIGREASKQTGRYKTYKLDATKLPKQIDLTSHDGQEKGQTAAAIYKLENDRLTICMPYYTADTSTRPAEFKTAPGDTLMTVVFERLPAK
jgi:RNA polymerase sigma-70 factor (ECF subfamily)